jgi:hypothetical protein
MAHQERDIQPQVVIWIGIGFSTRVAHYGLYVIAFDHGECAGCSPMGMEGPNRVAGWDPK